MKCSLCGKEIVCQASFQEEIEEKSLSLTVSARGRDICYECLKGALAFHLPEMVFYLDPPVYLTEQCFNEQNGVSNGRTE